MALRKTLGEVVEAVRAECGLSTNTSRGIDHQENIRQLIRRHQLALAEDYDWQHLEVRRDAEGARKLMQAGSRYYNFPEGINPLKVTAAWVRHGGVWRKLHYGIGYPQHTAYDSDKDERTDPPTHWAHAGDDQFEVWPLPASNGATDGNNEIGFAGQKKLEALTEDASRLDMDDILVTLLVATEILAGQKRTEAAAVKGDAAMARMHRLRANLSDKTRFVMGRGAVGGGQHLWPRHPTHIR